MKYFLTPLHPLEHRLYIPHHPGCQSCKSCEVRQACPLSAAPTLLMSCVVLHLVTGTLQKITKGNNCLFLPFNGLSRSGPTISEALSQHPQPPSYIYLRSWLSCTHTSTLLMLQDFLLADCRGIVPGMAPDATVTVLTTAALISLALSPAATRAAL